MCGKIGGYICSELPRSSETVKMTMLVRVFDNPRVHSNTGYHRAEEARKKMCARVGSLEFLVKNPVYFQRIP